MEKLVALSAPFRLWLTAHGGAGLAFPLLVLVAFLAMYLLRKIKFTAVLLERLANLVPALSFDMTPGLALIRKTVQALVPTVLSSAIGALASGGNVEVAVISASAGPVAALSHELLKWLPFLPYLGQSHPAAFAALPKSDDDDLDPPTPLRSSPFASPAPRSVPPPSNTAACVASLALFAIMAFFCACAAVTPQDKAAAKTISSVAQDLCVIANAEQHAALTPQDVLSTFCATDAQLTPFINQLLTAKHAAMMSLAPDAGASSSAVPLVGCDAALDRGKALQCPIDDPDAGGWCSTLPTKDVQCLSEAKSCLVYNRCTLVSK